MEPEKPKPGLSPAPGLKRGGHCLFSYLGRTTPKHPATSPIAAVRGVTEDQETHRAGRLAPASEAMDPPKPSLERKERGLEKKRLQAIGAVLTPQSPSPQTLCQPIHLFVFPSSPEGKPSIAVQRDTVSISSSSTVSPPLPYFLRVRKVRRALDRSQVWGWYDLFSRVSNQCICVSASSPHHHHP